MITSTKLKIIFLDFDGVLDTAFYDSYLEQHTLMTYRAKLLYALSVYQT